MEDINTNIRAELVEALAKSSLLRYLGRSNPYSRELRKLLESAEVLAFPKGMRILTEGSPSDRMYFLCDGRVAVLRNGKRLCTLGRLGDVFGEVGVITGEVRNATIQTLSPVTCLATAASLAETLNEEENLMFLHLMQQALTRILMGRLQAASEELADAKAEATALQERIAVLEARNTELELAARREGGETDPGFHSESRQKKRG